MDKFRLGEGLIEIENNFNIRKIYIELTNMCNFSCKMCYRNKFREKQGMMSETVLDKLLAEMKEMPDLQTVVIGGMGEPLLHKDIKRVIKYIKEEIGAEVVLPTNGFFLDKYIDFMVKTEVNKIVLSDDFTEVGHFSDKLIHKLVKKIVKKRDMEQKGIPIVSVEMVITKDSIDKIDIAAKELIDIGVSEFIISNLLPIEQEYDHLKLYPADNAKYLEKFIRIARGKSHLILPYFNLKTERTCNFVNNRSVVIRWDGAVAPCYRLLHDSTEIILGREKQIIAKIFGNINEMTLYEIWNSRDFKWFRFTVQNALYPSCLDCDFNDVCEFVKTTENDCWGNNGSCGDCLWSRNIIICP